MNPRRARLAGGGGQRREDWRLVNVVLTVAERTVVVVVRRRATFAGMTIPATLWASAQRRGWVAAPRLPSRAALRGRTGVPGWARRRALFRGPPPLRSSLGDRQRHVDALPVLQQLPSTALHLSPIAPPRVIRAGVSACA